MKEDGGRIGRTKREKEKERGSGGWCMVVRIKNGLFSYSNKLNNATAFVISVD